MVVTNPHTTDEWWAIDGVSLHQYGWNVATVGGSRYDLPPRRGENIRIAYRPGTLHRAKMVDSRTINLIMWVTGGYRPNSDEWASDQQLAWNDSWDFLRRLVWKPGGSQITLTRRWRLTVNGTPTTVVASALAEIADTMTPTMTGRTRADFVMTLLLADPFFYGSQVSVPLVRNDVTSVANAGHDDAAYGDMEVDLIGPLVNPKLTNSTPDPNVWLKYNGTIADGYTVKLNLRDFTAQYTSNATGNYTNVLGKVVHSGTPRSWMTLMPGGNALTLTSDNAASYGSAVIRYQPPYI